MRRKRIFLVASKIAVHAACVLFEDCNGLFGGLMSHLRHMPADLEKSGVLFWFGEGLPVVQTQGPSQAVRATKADIMVRDGPLGRYYLSVKACRGILNRAAKRKKRLPAQVVAALQQRCGVGNIVGVGREDPVCRTITTGTGRMDVNREIVVAKTGPEDEIVPCLGTQPSWRRTGDVGGGIPRRLTPIECERLQGFVDGYTAGQSDTQRYAQLGDSMAVPVVRWLGRRLLLATGWRQFSFASMFSGIEAASVAWCEGKWTETRWASAWGPGLGARCVLMVEKDPHRQRLLRERWL